MGITCVHTWGEPDPEWAEKLKGIGCRVEVVEEDTVFNWVSGLDGATIIGCCNPRFLRHLPTFRALKCKIIWMNCMNALFAEVRLDHQNNGCFDAYVFQSEFQRDQLTPQLNKWGYRAEQGHVIRGAFEVDDFEFKPLHHEPGEVLNVGHLSRAGVDKYPADLWRQYNHVPHSISARVMAWSDEIQDKVGPRPVWAEVFPACYETTAEFLSKIHVLAPGFGCCTENWPRVGLEAMAAGVVVVAENKGGWKEMIDTGITGWLCDTWQETSYRIAQMAYDPCLRDEIVHDARDQLECVLANPNTIWAGWEKLLGSL